MARTAKPAMQAQVELPDGRPLEFELRCSAKARSLRLKVSAREGLVVTAPENLGRARVMQLVAGKAAWIAERLSQFDAVRYLMGKATARPQAFDLPALAESWQVEYRSTRSRTVGARPERSGRIVVSG